MKGFKLFGEVIFEYIVITLLIILSLALVVPFVPVFVGLVGYFSSPRDYRLFKDIFKNIGKNAKIIIKFTIFELIILIFSILNLYFFTTNYRPEFAFILIVSSITLLLGAVFLLNAPVIILNMQVNLRELIYNSLVLVFGKPAREFLCLLALAAVALLAAYAFYLVPFAVYFVPFAAGKLIYPNFRYLKARYMHVSVADMDKTDADDGYLNEYGEVDHSSDEIKK